MKPILTSVLLIFTIFMTQAQDKIQPTITVIGEGAVMAVPDKVTIKVRVEEEGKIAQEVKQQTDVVVDGVIKFLRKMNIEDKYVQTNYVRLDKSFDYNKKEYKYKSNQSITIQLQDIEDYESVMNGLIETGINRVDDVQFGVSNYKELEVKARQAAVKNAKDKATEYTQVLGQSVGKAITISEASTSNPQPQVRMMAMEADFASSSAPQETIAKGELVIKTKITIVFELN